MRDDEMDFWLIWLGVDILEFSRKNKDIRGEKNTPQFATE